ncbi:type II toxin-antitoxin system RelE/ParE family toxin [Nitratidesulfovibrio termitidis]|uniref:type II toxin-antitoxin system RelE/ParE family toxin n=1 Tax=Nitratidesulfovibrio termitidis TaxID=42252 RepID=UPI000410FDAC|nr:type II toxin-antitoxin system RelE/ParE family toxin [Nitratidesulfovibrio termitidis]
MPRSERIRRFSPLAEADIEEIWLYTFRQWSLEQANDYHNGIMAAIAGLASGSRVWQRVAAREGYWKYKVGMHVVYFRASDEYLDVIRILHGRMDVDMHLQEQE